MSTATPRKKASRKSAGERGLEIRAAAVELAREDGLAGLTLRAIAGRVGVVPALVAHYEPSMEQLVADTFRTLAAAELDEIAAITASPAHGPVERLSIFIATTLDPSRDKVTTVWVDAWSLGRRNPALAEAVRDLSDAWEALALAIVGDGVATGVFTTTDPEGVAWLVIGIVDGLNAQSAIHDRHDAGTIRIVRAAVERELGLAAGALG